MSPILVRPVREQLEHDRLVRLLQTKSRRRFDAVANPGNQQNAPVRVGHRLAVSGPAVVFAGSGRRLQAIVEVETGESVNHLEALAQWAPLSKLKVDFFLYVPANMVDVARRLCEDNKVQVTDASTAIKRNTIRMFQFVPIPAGRQGQIIDIAFHLLQDKRETIAVKVFAMTVLENLSVKSPELGQELRIILEDQLPYAGPAFRSRASKILKRLSQARVR